MGTQAVVSVVKDGKVQVKMVCGCNGFHAEKLAQHIMQSRILDTYLIYATALKMQFGCERCLVAMDNRNALSLLSMSRIS